MAERAISRLHAVVEGHVQGVGYRMFVERTASSLGITGWVRNRSNGDVETITEGERDVLEKFLLTLQTGPRAAIVYNVHVDWQEATGEFNYFQVKPTL